MWQYLDFMKFKKAGSPEWAYEAIFHDIRAICLYLDSGVGCEPCDLLGCMFYIP